MKKIAIVTKYMMAGGIEKALINMLNTFSKEKYDVTLYVEKLGGDFFEDIPSYVNVKVIPEIECGNKERIGSALKSFKIGRSIEITKGLIHNYQNREYVDQCIGMCKILPKVEESYDLAIAYSAPVSLALYYVAYNIKANKKWTWIHNEVDQITVDIQDAENVFKEYNKIFCVSKLAKEKFDLKLPKYKNKSEVFYNIMDFRLMEEKSKEKIDEDEVGGKFLAIYPDHSRLVQRRVNSQWIYSYVPSENDLFSDKQPYYRLHSTNDSFASENGNMVFDSRGYLYVATLLGVQVCDREGLVRAILPIPGEQIHSLCLGGKDMNELYVLTEDNLYVRKLNTSGI